MDSRPQVFVGTGSPLWRALKRGFSRHCPGCGKGSVFQGYLTVNACCPACSLDLSIYRVDDAPPYFTILIVGHVIVPGMLLLEQFEHPPTWVHSAIWLPLTLLLTLLLLPRVKGALLALHWAKRIGV